MWLPLPNAIKKINSKCPCCPTFFLALPFSCKGAKYMRERYSKKVADGVEAKACVSPRGQPWILVRTSCIFRNASTNQPSTKCTFWLLYLSHHKLMTHKLSRDWNPACTCTTHHLVSIYVKSDIAMPCACIVTVWRKVILQLKLWCHCRFGI